jgi:hypothetical protein
MKILREFRRFILIKSVEGNEADLRWYVYENLNSLALGFGVPAEVIIQGVDSTKDDRALATRFLEIIAHAELFQKQNRDERRARAAQASAEVLAASTIWKGQQAHLDMMSLMSSALTRRNDMLVFTCDQFTVGVSKAPLLDLSRIARVRADLTGFVDAGGLHLRWRTGGLHLYPHTDPRAAKVIVHLPPMPVTVAA